MTNVDIDVTNTMAHLSGSPCSLYPTLVRTASWQNFTDNSVQPAMVCHSLLSSIRPFFFYHLSTFKDISWQWAILSHQQSPFEKWLDRRKQLNIRIQGGRARSFNTEVKWPKSWGTSVIPSGRFRNFCIWNTYGWVT